MYARDVELALARFKPAGVVTDADLASLPPLLGTYLRRVGVVGRPHVRNVHARWRARMRNGTDPSTPWMTATAEQWNFFDPVERLFFMKASRSGVPFQGYHRYVGSSATMQIRLLSLFDVAYARGPEMDQSETVTVFNDMCLLAPASLIDAPIRWQTIEERTLRGTFTNAGHPITADLLFDEAGDLVDFVSNDRYQSADGKTYRKFPWQTPVAAYRDYGGVRLASGGDALWKQPEGDFVYGKFELESVEYDLTTSALNALASARGPSRARPRAFAARRDAEASRGAWSSRA